MLKIRHYDCPEISYMVKVLFNDYLGLEYQVEFHENASTEIILENGRSLVFPDSFFSRFNYSTSFINKKNIPEKISWTSNEFTEENRIPIIFGTDKVVVEESRIVCNVDVLASSFFMLSRWEEAAIAQTDVHDRFIADNALAVKEGFLEKPVVNQYLDFIWNMLHSLGINQLRNQRSFKIEVSHDVDVPFMLLLVPCRKVIRNIIVDMVKRRSLLSVIRNMIKVILVRTGNIKKDPFYTFDEIMDISEKNEMKSTFFFLAGGTSRKHDTGYDIAGGTIRALMSEISERGHNIGLHGSYNSFNNGEMIREEMEKLKTSMKIENIPNKNIGSRQHFLRWKTSDTFQHLENAGIIYDTSLVYADKPGFRAGTCYPFHVFNVQTRKMLNLIERPLIVMDCSLTEKRYLNLNNEKALKKALELKYECKRYGGVFALLWHNTQFANENSCNLYKEILKG